jgi:hypothetical protein
MERVDSTSLPAGTECVGRWLKSDFGWPRTWDGCHGSYAPPADDDRGRVLLYTIPTLIPQRALVSVCRFGGHGESNLRTLHFGKRLRNRTAPSLVFAFPSPRLSVRVFFPFSLPLPCNVHDMLDESSTTRRRTSRSPSRLCLVHPPSCFSHRSVVQGELEKRVAASLQT